MKTVTEAELKLMQKGGAAVRRAPGRKSKAEKTISEKELQALQRNGAKIKRTPKRAPKIEEPEVPVVEASLPDPKIQETADQLQRLETRMNTTLPEPVVAEEAPRRTSMDAQIIRDEDHRGDYKPIDRILVKDNNEQEWEFQILRDKNVKGLYKPITQVKARALVH